MANLTDIKGVSDSRAEDLEDEGFTSVDDVAEADAKDLTEVSGVGEATAYDLIDSAQGVLKEEHLGEEEAEEETEEEREDVDLEDLEEVNEEPPEGYAEGEPEEPDDEEGEGEEEVEDTSAEDEEDAAPEEFDVEIEVNSDLQYDFLLKALVDMKLERSSNNQATQNAIQKAIDAVRPLGGEGQFSVTVTANELNRLHAAVQQAETRHQRNRQTDAFEAMREMKDQVNAARSEYVF